MVQPLPVRTADPEEPATSQHPQGSAPPVDVPPPKAGELYADWSRTYTFTPQKVYSPTSVEEISSVLKMHEDSQVSVIASGHSCSGNWQGQIVITLDSMPKDLEDRSDEGDWSKVRVSANMDLRECLKRLAEHGRTLPGTGGVDSQQLGGLLGTFTAPACKELGIYDDVVSIEYATKDKPNNTAEKDELKVFICNLGIAGIVTYVTLGTRRNKGFRAIQRILPCEDLIALMKQGKNFTNTEDDDKEEYPFWRLDWIPDTDKALLWAAREVDAVEHPDYDSKGDYVDSYARMPLSMRIMTYVESLSLKLICDDPYHDVLTKCVYGLMSDFIESDKIGNTFYGPLRNMLPVDRFANKKVFCAMAEWAFNPEEIEQVVKIYLEYFKKHLWPNLPIEIEYVKCDESHMSPWNSKKMNGGPFTFLVKMNVMWYYYPIPGGDHEGFRKKIEKHAKGLWDQLKEQQICFKAHWGKVNFTSPEDVTKSFEWDEFKPYIQSQFLNDYYRDRLPLS